MVRRTSSSRPITGSSFPCMANAVRSVAYLDRLSIISSLTSLSIVRPLRCSSITLSSCFFWTPAVPSSLAAVLLPPQIATNIASTEIKLSPRCFVQLSASATIRPRPGSICKLSAPLPVTSGSLDKAASSPSLSASIAAPLRINSRPAACPSSSNNAARKCSSVMR